MDIGLVGANRKHRRRQSSRQPDYLNRQARPYTGLATLVMGSPPLFDIDLFLIRGSALAVSFEKPCDAELKKEKFQSRFSGLGYFLFALCWGMEQTHEYESATCTSTFILPPENGG